MKEEVIIDIVCSVLANENSTKEIYAVLNEFIPNYTKLSPGYTTPPNDENYEFSSEEEMLNYFINNTDFAPTLIELAGGSAPDYMQGQSFAAALEGKTIEEWREGTYYRYWMHLVHHDVPAHFGIRTADYKLIYYYSEHYDTTWNGRGSMWWKEESYPIESTPKAWEFYDLKKDPQEMVNRYEDQAYESIIEDLKTRLKEMRTTLKETDKNYPHLEEVIADAW